MKFSRHLLPAASFVAGLAGVLLWPAAGTRETAAGTASGGGKDPAGLVPHPASPVPGQTPPAVLALAGLTAPPTIEDILAATGLDRQLRTTIFLLSASSPDIAALLDRFRDENVYDSAVTDQIWLRWVEVDRSAARERDGGGVAFWWAWAKLDPQAALASAAQEDPPRFVDEVIHSIGQGDFARAVQLLEEYPASDTARVWEGLLFGLAKEDRRAAATLALEKNVSLEEQVKGWVAREPEAALAWARGIDNPAARRRALGLAISQLTLSDPAAALQEAAYLPIGRTRADRTAEAITALARDNPSAARAAAEAISNPGERQRAVAMVATSLASRDPGAAVDLVRSLDWKALTGPSGLRWNWTGGGQRGSGNASDPSANPVLDLLSQLMQSAPQATADALAAQPAEAGAPLQSAMYAWAAAQPEAASTWLQGLPAGPVKDTAIEGLNGWLMRNPEPDFPAALAWAGAATPDRQVNLMQSALMQWKQSDPLAARDAVDQLPVTGNERERLLKLLE